MEYPQEDHSKEKGKGGGDNRKRGRWQDEGARKKGKWRRREKRENMRRGENRMRRRKKRGYKKREWWKKCTDSPQRSSKEKKRTGRERKKKRQVTGRGQEDGVWGEGEDGFSSCSFSGKVKQELMRRRKVPRTEVDR